MRWDRIVRIFRTSRGRYVYAKAITEGLEDYELHRAEFPTLDAFFPHLMDYLFQ